ncbi:MAG TPA: GNAT family N-acetyltransferase [Microbacteriaceae bacterium]|nr:GNAT family N-acetyltransferase [Microbacteriaceae bacterium]
MAKYLTHQEANEAGFSFTHREDESRFVLTKDEKVLGFARYTADSNQNIDFDSTFVDPKLRESGLAGLLVQTAVGSDIVKNRNVKASCWFVEGILSKHPEYLAEGAIF